MQRRSATPRVNWQGTVEAQGLAFHTPDGQTYWDESVYYEFAGAEIDAIEKASYALNEMCLAAVERIVQKKDFARFHIPPEFHDYVSHSWQVDEITIAGRFDLAYDGLRPPKLLEYNADTPTGLLEAAVVQWQWFKDTALGKDQFNSIHEKLIEAFGRLPKNQKVHFAAVTDELEDFVTSAYLRDTAMQAGLKTEYIDIAAIGWDSRSNQFVDQSLEPIRRCCKLYPWEWMIREAFSPHLALDTVAWLEAPWKMLLSNKEILVVLSEMYPGHENLLRAGHEAVGASYVKKPLLGREGANVTVVRGGKAVAEAQGPYGEQPFVYQELFELPEFDGDRPVIGSWMVNGYACGIGIRQDAGLVTGNRSRFVPHVMV